MKLSKLNYLSTAFIFCALFFYATNAHAVDEEVRGVSTRIDRLLGQVKQMVAEQESLSKNLDETVAELKNLKVWVHKR